MSLSTLALQVFLSHGAVSPKGTLYLGWGSVFYMPGQKNQYPGLMMLWVQLVTALQLHMDICGCLGGQSEAAAA